MMNQFSLLTSKPTILHYETLESTNNKLHELVTQDRLNEWTVVTTSNQTKGKGQLNNVWESEPFKNLTISVLIYPDFLKADQQFYLNMAVSNSLIEFFQYFQLEAYIKWPNDIYIQNKKIAGILIENTISSQVINTSIIGLGVNINQTVFSKSVKCPTSLKIENNFDYNLNDTLNILLSILMKNIMILKQKKFQSLNVNYLNKLFQKDILSDYIVNEQTIKGTILGVTNYGCLVVKHADGIIKNYYNKEIEFI